MQICQKNVYMFSTMTVVLRVLHREALLNPRIFFLSPRIFFESKDVDADQHFMSFKFEMVEGHPDNVLMLCNLLGSLIVEPYDYILDDQECLTEGVSQIRFNTTVQRLSCIFKEGFDARMVCDFLCVVSGCNCQGRRYFSLDIDDHQCLIHRILGVYFHGTITKFYESHGTCGDIVHVFMHKQYKQLASASHMFKDQGPTKLHCNWANSVSLSNCLR